MLLGAQTHQLPAQTHHLPLWSMVICAMNADLHSQRQSGFIQMDKSVAGTRLLGLKLSLTLRDMFD